MSKWCSCVRSMRTPTVESLTSVDKIKKFLASENIAFDNTSSPKMLMVLAKRRIKRREREAEAKDNPL